MCRTLEFWKIDGFLQHFRKCRYSQLNFSDFFTKTIKASWATWILFSLFGRAQRVLNYFSSLAFAETSWLPDTSTGHTRNNTGLNLAALHSPAFASPFCLDPHRGLSWNANHFAPWGLRYMHKEKAETCAKQVFPGGHPPRCSIDISWVIFCC
jgi:hypothetical protein